MNPTKKPFKIKPPYIAFLLLFLSWLADYFFPQFKFISGNYKNIGIFVFLIGISLLLWSFYTFKKNKTPIIPGQKPTFMVAQGPYKFTRNPMYLGVIIALFGAAIYIGNLLSLLSPIIFFIIMNFVFIPFEEKLMEKIFKKQYINYKRKVRRWL